MVAGATRPMAAASGDGERRAGTHGGPGGGWLLNSPGARDTDEGEQWQLTQFF